MKAEGRTAGVRYSSPAVEQATQILFGLANNPSPQVSLAEIAAKTGVSGSKAFGILEALRKSGLVKKGKDGKGYALGSGLITLSRRVLDDLVPSQLAEPVLAELTSRTASTSVFGLIGGQTVYVAAKQEPEENIRAVMRVGQTLPLTFGAHGKAIVAFLPEADQKSLLKEEALFFHNSIDKLDRTRLEEELIQARVHGFACDFGESAQGINVVASPVLGSAGVPVGFVEIFVLASAEQACQFGPVVALAAKSLSRQMGAGVD